MFSLIMSPPLWMYFIEYEMLQCFLITIVFLIDSQLMRHPLIKLFHLSNLLQIPNHYRVLDAEFFGNFLHTCKKFGFNDGSQSSTSDGWSLCSLSSRLSYRTSWTTTALLLVVPGSNALLMLWVVSTALQLILNKNKKTAWICFLSNIISIIDHGVWFC